jgi:hypothetical protein
MNVMQAESLEMSEGPNYLRLTWVVEESRENLIVATLSCFIVYGLIIGISVYLMELGIGVIAFLVVVVITFLVTLATLKDAWFGSRREFIELTSESLVVSKCFPYDVLALDDTDNQDYFSTLPWARRRKSYPTQSIKKIRLDSLQDCHEVVCELNDDREVELIKTKNADEARTLTSAFLKKIGYDGSKKTPAIHGGNVGNIRF